MDEFIATGGVSRAFLGIRYRLISRDVAILNEVPQGAYIEDVVPASPAQKAGIAQGDIITKINGNAINAETSIADVITGKKVGDRVSLEIWTDGNTRTLNIVLEQSPSQ